MGVYEDIANDAGYAYGTDENRQMAEMIYQHEREEYYKYLELEEENHRREILFRKFK